MQERPGAVTKSLPVKTMAPKTRTPERRQVLKHSGYLLAARLLSRTVTVPFLIYAAATLGPELFGILAFVLAGVEMLSAVGDFGLSRYGARAMVRDSGGRARMTGVMLAVQMQLSVVLAAAVIVALAFFGPGEPKTQVILLGLGALMLSPFILTTDAAFTASSRFGVSALMVIAGRAVYIIAGAAFLAAGYSVVAVMAAYLLGMAVEAALRLAYTLTRLTSISLRAGMSSWRRVWRQALPFAVAGAATLVYFRADTLILDAMSGDAAVGVYNAAYSIFSLFVWVPIIISRTLLPGLTSQFASDPERAELANWFWYRAVGVMGVPVAFTVTMLAGPLIGYLMPVDYQEAVLTLQLLMWSIPTLMMISVGINALVIVDREAAVARMTAWAAVAIVVIDAGLIYLFEAQGVPGIYGAAVAMIVVTAVWLLRVQLLLGRHVHASGRGVLAAFGLPAAAGLVMAAAALLADGLGTPLSLAAGLAAYALVVLPGWRKSSAGR